MTPLPLAQLLSKAAEREIERERDESEKDLSVRLIIGLQPVNLNKVHFVFSVSSPTDATPLHKWLEQPESSAFSLFLSHAAPARS